MPLKHKASAILAMALLFSCSAMAQDSLSVSKTNVSADKENELTVDFQMLTRGEIRNGGLITGEVETEEDKAQFVLSRSRLVIDYQRPFLETKLTLQHQGVWGQSGKGVFNVHEAWAKLKANNGLFAQVGRVAMAYDDERIIGFNDWAVASLSHDVVRVGYEGFGHKAHAIFAFNQNAENMRGGSYYVNGAQPYKTMQTVWYHYDVPTIPLGASLLFMNVGMQSGEKDVDAHTEWQQLLGSYIKYQPKQWTMEGSYYRQLGKNEDGIKIKAWMASLRLTFNPTDKYGFVVGYDYMSGDKNFAVPPKGTIGYIRHNEIKGFNPIYGSHHKFYGAMDFFYVSTYVGGFTPGLQNAYVGARVKPIKNLSLMGRYHYFAIAANLDDMDKTLGHEIEMQASYNVIKDVSISYGFSFMWGTDTMEKLKRASNQGNMRWNWLSLVVSPRIFSIKW